MRQQWAAWVARLDALTVRERLIMFATVLLGAIALFDAVWLAPARAAHQQLSMQLGRQSAELVSLREAVRVSPRPQDANRALRDQLVQTQDQLAQIEQQIRSLLPGAKGATPLAQVLVHLLRRHAGLTLVRTEALSPEVPGPGNQQAGTRLPEGLVRQGVALTVSGSYADLVRYVDTLEAALPFVRWGPMQLAVQKGRTELTLQLFLIHEVVR